MAIGIAILAGVLILSWLYLRVFSPRPKFPPLHTDPADPLMLDALEKARSSLRSFFALLAQPHENALVKLRFVSSSREVEHLWAEVLRVISDTELEVRLVTPPVTHSGRLERVYTCSTDDLEDWHVRDTEGRLHGGFTQRAMFGIARRDGVKLPPELLEQEKQYADGR